MAKPAYVWTGHDWAGISGPEGKPGPGLNIRGVIDDSTKLPTKGSPGDGYIANDTGNIWTWQAITNTWIDSGLFRGPKGDAGETLKISGVVTNEASLPTAPTHLTVLMTQDTSSLFIYDPSSPAAKPSGYVDMGAIAGPKGDQGPVGPVGPDGPGMFFAPAVDTELNLPPTGVAGELRIVNNNGHVYSWDPVTSTWIDGGLLVQAGAPAKLLPPVPDTASLPWPGVPGTMVITQDDGHLWSWNGEANAGVGDWTDAGVYNFRINTAGDYFQNAYMSTGYGLVWNNTMKKWYAGLPDTAVVGWDQDTDYLPGMMCQHNGQTYIALRPNLGTVPGSQADAKAKDWRLLNQPVVGWKPGTDWEAGQLVWVPDVATFYHDGKMDPFDGDFDPAEPGSLWIATRHMSGSTPVGTGEPCSLSDVPPGYKRFNSYNPPTGGGIMYDTGWQLVEGPTVHYFSSASEMASLTDPRNRVVRQGDLGINVKGDQPIGTKIQVFDLSQPYSPLTGFWNPTRVDSGFVPAGIDDRDMLSWDATEEKWVTSVFEMGAEVNVSFHMQTADTGVPVYDESNNTFQVRQLEMQELVNGPWNTPNDDDVLTWDGTRWESMPAQKLKYQVIGKAAFAALTNPDPDTLYLVSGA